MQPSYKHDPKEQQYLPNDSGVSETRGQRQQKNFPRRTPGATAPGRKQEPKQLNMAPPKVDRTKYKTELCKNWVELRNCRYGTKCQFAHGYDELYVKEPQNSKYKSKECMTFSGSFFCPYGERCLFQHE